jgi:hypothetical protein
MTIEHLAPQCLIGHQGYSDDVTGQLGNLLLVSDELNGKLENKAFKDKKKVLHDNGYKLPKAIEQATTWTAAEIKLRTDALAEQACNIVWKP